MKAVRFDRQERDLEAKVSKESEAIIAGTHHIVVGHHGHLVLHLHRHHLAALRHQLGILPHDERHPPFLQATSQTCTKSSRVQGQVVRLKTTKVVAGLLETQDAGLTFYLLQFGASQIVLLVNLEKNISESHLQLRKVSWCFFAIDGHIFT